MLCNNCNKLAFASTNKKCMKCPLDVFKSIAILCISCSEKDNICEICLKKLIPTQNMNNLIKPFFKSKCGSCRKIMLITFDENKLRQPNESVSPEEIPKLISILERELNEYNRLGKNGIGLAAPQIGINKRIAIIRLTNKPYYDFNIDLINPKIVRTSKPILNKEEGCLSFPNKIISTNRFDEVQVVNDTPNQEPFIVTGLLAIACQHEIDHLDGVLMFDRQNKPIVNKIKIGPNDKCSCGSNIKYKRCCGK